MLFATWAEGGPFLLVSVFGLVLFGVMIFGLSRSFDGAGPVAQTAIVIAIGGLVIGCFVAVMVALIGVQAVGCAPDAYECPF